MGALAAIAWDPQIRGAVIVLTALTVLPGSVYLLLSTNTGIKVGFLLAAAGLAGWMTLMAFTWVLYGIGMKGDPAHWKVIEVVTGDVARLTTQKVGEGFPKGWKVLEPGNAALADATAAADKVLAPSEDSSEAEGAAGESPDNAEQFQPAFKSLEDFVIVGGYDRGGEDFYLPGGYIERSNGFLKGWFHKPHYTIVQAAPVLEQPVVGGAPPKPVPDPAEPLTSVMMIRDLGSLRFPSFLVALVSAVLFGIICNVLHHRDKEIMAAKAAGAAAG